MKAIKVPLSNVKTIPKGLTSISQAKKIDLIFMSVVITSLEK